jgi:hypothetical protein
VCAPVFVSIAAMLIFAALLTPIAFSEPIGTEESFTQSLQTGDLRLVPSSLKDEMNQLSVKATTQIKSTGAADHTRDGSPANQASRGQETKRWV